MKALLAALLIVSAAGAGAAEPVSVESLQKELQTLRAQNAQLQRENAELKGKLGEASAKVAATASDSERQEDKPKNKIRLPSNVTINHNPR